MTKDELITKQQLEIEHYKAQTEANRALRSKIVGQFVNIGQPLNDNVLQFNTKQQRWAGTVLMMVEELSFMSDTEDQPSSYHLCEHCLHPCPCGNTAMACDGCASCGYGKRW